SNVDCEGSEFRRRKGTVAQRSWLSINHRQSSFNNQSQITNHRSPIDDMRHSLRSWLWRVPRDQEVDEELAMHIDLRTRELVERGLDPKRAREIVLSRIGGLGQLKRTCVDLGRKRESRSEE